MKNLEIICALVLLCNISYSQGKLPALDYIPQSPTAAAYSRYGEIPVDYSTGIPEIEIPIYNVKVGDVSIPFNISYHSSGIKVRDVASEVGLGFVFNGGGVITATIVGTPDLDPFNTKPLYRTSNNIETSINNARLSYDHSQIMSLTQNYWRILNPITDYTLSYDNFSDRFQYSLCTGESGIFRKDFITDSIRFLPYQPIKVALSSSLITIVSTNGYTHYFRNASAQRDYFVIDKIVSQNKTDSICYYYTKDNESPRLDINYLISWQYEEPYIKTPEEMGCLSNCCPQFSIRNQVNRSTPGGSGGLNPFITPLLDSVVTKNEVIKFLYESNRQDDVFDIESFLHNRLVRIIIKNRRSQQVIKVVNLSHSYFGTQTAKNRRLKLDSVLISGSTNETVEKYSFAYNTSLLLPAYPALNGLYEDDIWYEDYWGYYNGVSKNNLLPGFIGDFQIPTTGIRYAGLNPDGFYSQANILTSINYPQGGKTLFEYEPNTLSGNIGGLRIKKITSYTNDTSPAFVKSYTYDPNSMYSKGIVPAYYKDDSPQDHYGWYREGNGCEGEQYWSTYQAYSQPLRPITITNGATIIYGSVTEYIGDETSNIGKTVYSYEPPEDPESRYPLPGDIDTRYISFYHADVGNYIPQLSNKSFYKYDNGDYKIVKSEDYSFTKYKQREFNTGLSFASKIIIEPWGNADPVEAVLTGYEGDGRGGGLGGRYFESLVYMDTKGYEETKLLTSSVVADYIDSETIVETTTTYSYETSFTQLSQKLTFASDGKALKTVYKYPIDFTGTQPYDSLIVLNTLTPVIEQSGFKNGVLTESMKTNYRQLSKYLIVPSTIETKNGTDPYETRVHYFKYDINGNVLCVSKENDVKTSYLWGYNNTYPVAKITGTDYDAVASILTQTDRNILNSPSNDQQVLDIISKIRLHPSMANAMVYSYTYKPLIGISSVTDPAGVKTFYEYDSFNRLQSIRDNSGNIVKATNYHYRKQ